MKRATAYKLRDLVIVHSNSQTIDGIWIVGAPFTTIRFDDSVESLGDMIHQALAMSANSVPPPTEWESVIEPVLSLAGVKSWSAFVRRVEGAVEIEQNGDRIVMTATKNLGAEGGFEPIDGTKCFANINSGNWSIGNQLRCTFTHCR